MDKDEQLQEQIDRYLAGEMSEEEHQGFQQKVDVDPQLQEEIALVQSINDGLKQTSKNPEESSLWKTYQEVRAIGQEREAERNGTTPLTTSYIRLLRSPWAWAAAAVILLLIVFTWSTRSLTPPDYKQIAMEQFDYYPDKFSNSPTRSPSSDSSRFIFMMRAYQDSSYQVAKDSMDSWLANPPQDTSIFPSACEIQYYRGHTHWHLKEYVLAIQDWEMIIADSCLYFVHEAHWYLALSYLMQEKPEFAIDHLKAVASSEDQRDFQVSEAQSLLRRLD